MDGITWATLYVSILLVGQANIQFGTCAHTLIPGDGIFTIRHLSSGGCLKADLQGLRVEKCGGFPEEQWKWGSGHRLFHVVTAQCLGLEVRDMTVALMECGSSEETLSWRCTEKAIYAWSGRYLTVTNGIVETSNGTLDKWGRDNTSDSICHHPYQVVYTTGNSLGKPCDFPFLYNGTSYHGCVPTEDGKSWCFTTADYDTERKMGYCLKYEEGCEHFWNKTSTGQCYQHNKWSAVTWQEARATCRSQGGDLLSLSSAEELAQVYSDGDTDQMWIGLNQLDMAQGWQWSDGSPLTFVKWKEGMTSLSMLEESDCAVITPEGFWEKTACDNRLPFICEKAFNQTHTGSKYDPWVLKSASCESGWHQWNGFCYKLVKDQPQTHSEAQQSCSESGATLASVHSLAEIEMISTNFHSGGSVEVWTGLRSDETPPLFQWTDKSPVFFTHWARGEPRVSNGTTPTCVSYSEELCLWRVSSCENKLPFLCKKMGKGTETVIDADCPKDGVWRRHGGACYKVDTRNVPFKDRCDLTITSRFEQAFINSLLRDQSETQYFWVGLQDANMTGQYQWSNKDGPNDRVTYTNWAKDEPTEAGQCAVMSGGEQLGQWQLRNCSLFMAGSVCKKEITPHIAPEPEPQPNLPCPPGWESQPDASYCYKVFHGERLGRKRSWEEAERFCEALGAHLPSLSSQKEMSTLHEILRDSISNDRYFWIGLNRRNPRTGNAWEWSDGRPVSTVVFPEEFHKDDDYNRDCTAFRTRRLPTMLMLHILLRNLPMRSFYAIPFHCDAQLEWVCQIPRGKKPLTPEWYNPDGYHHTSVFIDGKEFWFVTDPKLSFEEARLYCSSNDSKLATPMTPSEVTKMEEQTMKLLKERWSWWIQAERDSWYSSFLFHPISYYHSRFLGRCTSLNPLSSFSEKIRRNSCEQRLPFVCEKVNITTVEDQQEHHPKGLSCGNDSLAFRDKCYTVVKPLYLSFLHASEYCKSLRGTLPVISSQAEQDFLISILPDSPRKFWVGLKHKQHHSQWQWVDGSTLTVDNFNTLLHGQLRYLVVRNLREESLDLCAFISNDPNPSVMGTWDYTTCSDQQYVAVCEHYADKPDRPKVVEETLVVRNHTYKFLQKNMTWFTAREQCNDQHMTLASVADGFQQAKLTVIANKLNGPLWIGLFSEDEGVHYRWTDHSHTVFSRWFSEPTSGRCVYLDTDGFWKATDCFEELPGAICHVPYGSRNPEEITVKCPHRANGPNWIPFRNNCYTFYRASSRWVSFDKGDPRETCRTLDPNAELLTVRDEAENEFVKDQLLPLSDLVDYVWIAIYKDTKTDHLKWYDGTYVQYSNWDDGRPNVTDEFMAGLSLFGSWHLHSNKDIFRRFKQKTVIVCKIDSDSKEEFSKYTGDYEKFGSLEYKLIPKKMTWPDALRECGEKGGQLASAHNLEQDLHLELISKHDGHPLWVGLSSQEKTATSFEWSDGTTYDYKPRSFMPSPTKGNCVLVDRRGSWVQADCASMQEGAICYHNTTQRSSAQASPLSNNCPMSADTSRWIQYKDHCYAFNMTFFNYSVFTMEEAKNICKSLDESSELLTIKDREENKFVSRYIAENPLITKRVWLGMDLNTAGEARWMDGTTLEFTNWDSSMPKPSGPSCVVLISGDKGMWRQVSCGESRSRIVCKAPVRSKGTPAAVIFFIIVLLALIAVVLFVLYRKNRHHFSSTVRYQRNFDDAGSTSILNDND
ncbi:hypothetical protein AGOR_G00070670 [Albula goreensis]|uniref:Lymphocyte antigen 75 n=1 Tax=Albula goreensis TaxID=1534307 RepID=A0A8T3DSC5_9TELE|nr:hypothetical protein AGOR_G00070670 [Albula goreensis]